METSFVKWFKVVVRLWKFRAGLRDFIPLAFPRPLSNFLR
jgi:hypothetical protein